MSENKPPKFELGPEIEIIKGLTLRQVDFPAGPARGRVLTCRIEAFEPKLYPFYELINSSFNPNWGYAFPPEQNLGVNIPQFLDRAKPEARRAISPEDRPECLFAGNTVHTNFVRGNGFVIVDGQLVYKPPGAVALDGDVYQPLGYHPDDNPNNASYFSYDTLILTPPPLRLQAVKVNRNVWLRQEDIQLAISGPRLVESAQNKVKDIPVRLKARGQTFGNEINYDPFTLRTSFTAFGIEQDSNRLVIVSMFAGRPGQTDGATTFFVAGPNEGITLYELAELMRLELNVSAAIAGGGAGDTQQYVYERGIWAGQPRHQPDRPQVKGLRGLGAILALLKK